ncbi:MAG: FHA domain-containing protein [Thermoplasmatota archaeon]
MPVDYQELESYLKALGQANRLELLDALRVPRTLDEIRLNPSPGSSGNPERTMTRQGIQNHLNKLIDAGVVTVAPTDRKGKRGILEYRLAYSRLFAVVEELRALTLKPAAGPVDPFATQTLVDPVDATWADGPKLVLVHGVREGRAFALLQKDLHPPRGWVIGRAASAAVRLEYDPFVSQENAEILHQGRGFTLLDLRSSRNGTFLNWKRLAPGAEAPLSPGDVIGLGRTLLVFRAQ